jgi:ATP-binding cassette subfamily F protein uup
LLLLQDISLSFGTTPVLAGAGLAVGAGDRLCLVGRNGSGKSTLLRVPAGLVQPEEETLCKLPAIAAMIRPANRSWRMTSDKQMLTSLHDRSDDRHRARYLLQQLGLTGGEDPNTLSGGEARRAGARAGTLTGRPAAGRTDKPSGPARYRVA